MTDLLVEKLPKKWTQKDGTRVRIKDMESSHILNCMALIQRNGDRFYGFGPDDECWFEPAVESLPYRAFLRELYRRGELGPVSA